MFVVFYAHRLFASRIQHSSPEIFIAFEKQQISVWRRIIYACDGKNLFFCQILFVAFDCCVHISGLKINMADVDALYWLCFCWRVATNNVREKIMKIYVGWKETTDRFWAREADRFAVGWHLFRYRELWNVLNNVRTNKIKYCK